ncbi:MAG TPA: histidine kinase [Gaiellales bacterium]|nr:histidine kinase [Gaiellales bacterium]
MMERFSVLARNRVLGVGLALVAQISLVGALTVAPAPAEAGIPALIAAAISGTVAVVFGPLDGMALALVGAALFGVIEGGAGAPAALVVWPSVVGGVGLFARRVEQQRDLLRELVSAQEAQRRRAAASLYDEQAQVLAGALLMLRAAGHDDSEAAAAAAKQARDSIGRAISELRTIAGELSPRGLEQQGLVCALEQLAETLSQMTSVTVAIDALHEPPLAFESQLAVYRLVEDVLAALIENGKRDLRVEVNTDRHDMRTSIWCGDSQNPAAVLHRSRVHQERLRLLGGHLHIDQDARGPLLEAVVPTLR